MGRTVPCHPKFNPQPTSVSLREFVVAMAAFLIVVCILVSIMVAFHPGPAGALVEVPDRAEFDELSERVETIEDEAASLRFRLGNVESELEMLRPAVSAIPVVRPNPPPAPTPPSSISRVHVSDITFDGSWTYQNGSGHGINLVGSSGKTQGIFVRPNGNGPGNATILHGGHIGKNETALLAELAIPTPVNSPTRNQGEIPIATNWVNDARYIGKDYAWLSHQAPGVANRGWELYGFVESEIWGGTYLLALSRFYYNTKPSSDPASDLPALFANRFDDVSDPKGFWRVGDGPNVHPFYNHKTAHWIGEIPVALRPLFGGHTHWCGCYVRQGSSKTSHGPSFYAFTPPASKDEPEGYKCPAMVCMQFDESAPYDGGLQGILTIDTPWNTNWNMYGATLIYTSSGKAAMAFFVHRSFVHGHVYGGINESSRAAVEALARAEAIARGLTGSDVDDAEAQVWRNGSKGYHGGPDSVEIHLFDLEELAAAGFAGTPQAPQPYEVIIMNRTIYQDPTTDTNEPTSSTGKMVFFDESNPANCFPWQDPGPLRGPNITASYYCPGNGKLYADEAHAAGTGRDYPVTAQFTIAQ